MTSTRSQKPITSPADTAGYTLESVMAMLSKRFDETNQNIDTSKDELNNKLDSIKEDLQKQIMSVEQNLNALKAACDDEHRSLSSRTDQATENVQRLENRAELIVSGVPYITNENLRDHILHIADTIGFDCDRVSHIHCKRLRSDNLPDGSECFILLQFSVVCLGDEFYSKYLSERDLKLSPIGFSSDRRIYINENLTVNARAIKRAALKLRRENKLAAVSTKLGVVQVKKTASSPSMSVASIDQLMQI